MDPVVQHQLAWTHLASMMALCAMSTQLIQSLDHNKNAILYILQIYGSAQPNLVFQCSFFESDLSYQYIIQVNENLSSDW